MITRKLKICFGCKLPKLIYKNIEGEKYCKSCTFHLFVNQFKQINPISKKQTKRIDKYKKLRDQYFKEHPICEFPGCESTKITCHHKKGRVGNLMFENFCSLCLFHHQWCEENPEEAIKLGLSLKRLNE